MNLAHLDGIARAVLYEGYLLYPYRRSSLKNQQRWMFGTLYPPAFASATDASSMRTECLVRGGGSATLETRVRFLHFVDGADGEGTWQEAQEREVVVADRRLGDLAGDETAFAFPGGEQRDGATTRRWEAVRGVVERGATRLADDVFKITVVIRNLSPLAPAVDPRPPRPAALRVAFASTHTLLGVRDGELVSLLEPPPPLAAFAAGCENVGTWPVLVGKPGARDTMLSSPIILDDYPRIAPESPGDFFDGTEIDEMLTLRIQTLTEGERGEVRMGDARGGHLLDRIDALDDDARRALHGAVRERAVGVPRGARVRLRPRGRADVFDLALDGRVATVAAVEQDYEGRVFLVVTVDDDPGADLGAAGQVGHRFFFRPDEVEVLP